MADTSVLIDSTFGYRVEVLEKNYEKLEGKMDLLLTNHLPHLQQEVASLRTRIAVLTAVNVGAIILALLINKFL